MQPLCTRHRYLLMCTYVCTHTRSLGTFLNKACSMTGGLGNPLSSHNTSNLGSPAALSRHAVSLDVFMSACIRFKNTSSQQPPNSHRVVERVERTACCASVRVTLDTEAQFHHTHTHTYNPALRLGCITSQPTALYVTALSLELQEALHNPRIKN